MFHSTVGLDRNCSRAFHPSHRATLRKGEMEPQEFIAPPDLICCVCALSRRPFAGKATSMELRRNNQNCSQLARECRTARHASAREVRRILEVTNLTYRRIL